MKRILFLTTLAIWASTAFAQTWVELRPVWAKSTPNPPAGANYFLQSGVGEGSNETEAYNAAWADALRKSLHELGVVGITQQDIDAVRIRGVDGVISFNRMKRRSLCQTEFIPKLNGAGGKMYVLIQIQRSVHGADDFYNIDMHVCDDADFDRKIAGYKSQLTGKYPFSPRVFVPGMAQIHKGSTGKGVAFMVGETAMLGGIVAFEGMRNSYLSKMETTPSPSLKDQYAAAADNMKNLRNACIAGAMAVYVWNVIDGIAAKGKKHILIGANQLHIAPYATPSENGISLSLNF